MSKFFNTARGPVSATIGSSVVVFPPKEWTSLPDGELSASMKSLLDQRVLIPAKTSTVRLVATPSKPPVVLLPKKDKTVKVVEAPVKVVEAKVETKPDAKAKEDRPLQPSDKK